MPAHEPADKEAYTRRMDASYTRFARLYDWLIKWLPIRRNRLNHVLPHIEGPRLPGVSFGSVHLYIAVK